MAPQSSLLRVKNTRGLSLPASDLLAKLSTSSQMVTRLTGTPLELIGRDLATYDARQRGYELSITERGLFALRGG
jgi:hypothetical protein